ncbi:MAG: ATP-binding protein [Oscillospiraceae bacterium]|nr:ATP-binding protein [Oscillospiraceae bacterium]
MQRLQGRVRKACEMYSLIRDGERVAVGLSGGKDSAALLKALAGYRAYSKTRFELVALTLDPRFFGRDGDYGELSAFCESLGVEHFIKRTNLYEIIFETRKEQNPCALCARMRRGALHDLCLEKGCARLALGHHLNDAVETFYMNLFFEGRLAALAPLSYLSRKDIHLIRPLILASEREVEAAARRAALPVVKSLCPADGNTRREEIKRYIARMEARCPGFLNRSFTALQNAHLSGL